jgi:hypothetical protein
MDTAGVGITPKWQQSHSCCRLPLRGTAMWHAQQHNKPSTHPQAWASARHLTAA